MKKTKYQKVKDSLIIVGIATFFLYMFQLWVLLIPSVIATVVLAVVLVLMKRHTTPDEKSAPQTVSEQEPKEADVMNLAYSVILKRINALVAEFSQDAKWVWKEPNAKQRIADGEDVFIILNKAGGYKEAKVIIKNLCVTGLEFAVVKETPKTETVQSEITEEPQERVENYELAAFEWVEGHILDLNNRCNDEIGLGHSELVLLEDELPVKDSWLDVCNELKKQGLKKLELVPQGIKIILT